MTERVPEPLTNEQKLHRHLRATLYAVSWLFFLGQVFFDLQYMLGLDAQAIRPAWLCGIGWAFALVMWCREDAKLAGRPLPTFSLWVALLILPIAIPALVLRQYGALWGILLVGLHVALYIGIYVIAGVLMMPQ